MNKDRILVLAANIEQMHHIEDITEEIGDPENVSCFNMANYRFNCRAPACIAGHAAHRYRQYYHGPSSDTHIIAKEVLELTKSEANELFEPTMHKEKWQDIKPEHAARVMRHFVATNIVDWDNE